MRLAVLALFVPIISAAVSLEEIVCGINKARAEKNLPGLYTGNVLTKIVQEKADTAAPPNFPAQEALNILNEQNQYTGSIGVVLVGDCKTDSSCTKGILTSQSNYAFGKYTAVALVKKNEWYIAVFVDTKSGDLTPGKCGLPNPDNPNKVPKNAVRGQEVKLDPKNMVCLVNKERAKKGLPALGYSEQVSKVASMYVKGKLPDIWDTLEKEGVEDAMLMTSVTGINCVDENECIALWTKDNGSTPAIFNDKVQIAGVGIADDKQRTWILLVDGKSNDTKPPTGC